MKSVICILLTVQAVLTTPVIKVKPETAPKSIIMEPPQLSPLLPHSLAGAGTGNNGLVQSPPFNNGNEAQGNANGGLLHVQNNSPMGPVGIRNDEQNQNVGPDGFSGLKTIPNRPPIEITLSNSNGTSLPTLSQISPQGNGNFIYHIAPGPTSQNDDKKSVYGSVTIVNSGHGENVVIINDGYPGEIAIYNGKGPQHFNGQGQLQLQSVLGSNITDGTGTGTVSSSSETKRFFNKMFISKMDVETENITLPSIPLPNNVINLNEGLQVPAAAASPILPI